MVTQHRAPQHPPDVRCRVPKSSSLHKANQLLLHTCTGTPGASLNVQGRRELYGKTKITTLVEGPTKGQKPVLLFQGASFYILSFFL